MSNICPRLIDYVVFVGSRLLPNGASVQSPEILCRFPPTDHKDFPLPMDVSFFCQPEGCVTSSDNTFPVKSVANGDGRIKSMTFLFSLTDKDSSKTRYGICTNFFRPVNFHCLKKSQFPNPTEAGHLEDISFCQPIDDPNRSDENTQHNSISSGKLNNMCCTRSLTSICLITHHAFVTKFAQLVQCIHVILKKLHKLSKSSCSESPDIWDVLSCSSTLSCSTPVVDSIRQFQIWILRLLSAPAPVPGCTCVYLSVQPPTLGSPLCFALPDQSRLPLIDFPVNLPFEIMGIRKALRLIICLLLEQKVVLQSSDYNKLSLTILALVALLYPLQYMFPVIPLLPACMPDAEQLLLAPTPYLIGVPTAFYSARKIFHMPKDVWLADLDTRELSYPMVVDEIPELPEIEGNILISHLKKLLHEFSNSPHIDLDLDDSSKNWSYSAARTSALELSKFDPLLYTLTKDSVDVAIRVSMILFFNTNNVLGGFTNHIRTLRLFPRPVVAFQYESFMKSRPRPCMFTSMLAKTQAVEYFAESSICALNDAYQRIYSGVYSPELIGDKLYWYKDQLQSVYFDCWEKLIDCTNFTVTPTPTTEAENKSSTILLLDPSHSILFQAFDLAKRFINKRNLDDDDNDMITEIDTTSVNSSDSSNEALIDEFIGMFKTYSDETESLYSHETIVSDSETSKEMEDCILIQANKPLPDCLAEFYTPPTELVYRNESGMHRATSTENVNRTLSNSNDQSTTAVSDLNKEKVNEKIVNPNTGVFNSESDTLTRSPSISSKRSTNDTLQLVSRLSSSIFMSNGNDSKRPSTVPTPINNFGDDELSWDTSVTLLFGDLLKSNRLRSLTFKDVSLSALQIHKRRLENQRTIIDLAKSIKQGRIPNIFSRNHINTLLQDENYRNLLIARVNSNLTKEVLPNQPHIEDVAIQQWDQYKAILWTLKQMINGLEYSFRPDIVFPTTNQYDRTFRDKSPSINTPSMLTSSSWLTYSTGVLKSGGLASAFMLLEVAHTHFYRLPNRAGHTNNNSYDKFIWNSMPTTPTTEIRSSIATRELIGDSLSAVQYQRNHLDVSDSESYSRRSSKFELLNHGRGQEFTNVIVTMSEPSSDKEDNEQQIQSKSMLRSGSVHIVKRHVQSLNNTNVTIGAGLANTISESSSCIAVNQQKKNGKSDKLFTSNAKLCGSVSESRLTRDNYNDDDEIPPEYIPELPYRKSQRSFGYRYYQSHLILTDPSIPLSSLNESVAPSMVVNSSVLNTCTPPAIYCPELKFHFNDIQQEIEDESIDQQQQHQQQTEQQRRQSQLYSFLHDKYKLTLVVPTPAPPCSSFLSPKSSSSSSSSSLTTTLSSSKTKKVSWTYLFEDIFDTEWQKSKIWGNLQFWEDSFLDTVSQERDILGMDFRPTELLFKYQNASLLKRKQMELEEDCLLVNIMHNMIAFMLMANVDRVSIRKKLQRLLAKSHTGLHYSRKITDLLNSLNYLNGNDIDLNVAQSRYIVQRSHEAYRGSDDSGELIFLEVCSDYLLIRNLSGRILERVWYDQVINLTYRSHTHILCITRQIVDHSQMDLFYTRKSRLVYQQIKESMKNISVEATHGILNGDLDGEINAINLDSNQPGTISIVSDGFVIKFGDEQKFIKLHNIKRCCTIKSEIFTIDVYDQEKKTMITYRFQTDMTTQLFHNFVSLFSLSSVSNE
ncbi:MAP kinase-activating death domain protein [Schistosoma japonicum]|uniref:MAP kinase-activating death domain protein n=1 Tax=Schistosoma japonicum TaxID=6182 RepID=A0A4Z2CUI6_SCHJA|nr:MAP kinase-activating death domain protein [Schistosoma japonicum]